MLEAEDNAETVRSCVEALNRQDVDEYLACCTEDVELFPATVAFEGGYRQASGIRRFFTELQDTAPDFQITLERLSALGQIVLALERVRGSGRDSGTAREFELATIYEFERGKIRRIEIFPSREQALAAMGLHEAPPPI